MKKQFRILIVEDNAADAELAQRELRRGNIAFSSSVVATKEDFVRGLQTFAPDLILSDCTLPGFDGLSALAIAREKCPGTPFIFFSGTLENRGGECLKHGATAYVLKDRRSRLTPAVKQALRNLKSGTRPIRMSPTNSDNEARFRMLEEGVKEFAIYLLDPNGRVTSWNAGAQRLFGYDAAEIIGEHFSRFHLSDESQRRGPGQILQIASEQGRTEEEAWHVRKDESRFWGSTMATAVRDDAGNVKGFTCIACDITGRQQCDAEFKKAVQLYRTVAENIPNGIIAVFDQNLRYIAVDGNQALETVGFCKEGVEGKTIHELLSPEACLEIEPVYRAAIAGTATMTEIPMFGHNNYLVHVLPLRDGHGKIYAGIALAIDITERRLVQDHVRRFNQELERRVGERTAQLESVNDELEAFCYTVSHDLRAPLRAMQGLAEATLEDCGDQLDSTGKAYARRIIAAANRMDTLIQGLLSYSRLSRVDLQLGPVALDSVVRIALCQLETEIKERAARITVEGSLPRVMGHQLTLVLILSNMMLNGIKFVSPGLKPEVRIRAETRADRIRLWVEDNGIGISPEHHARIFNVFERLHGVETYPGTGIGLAIVRKGVERLGGRVGLESVPGSGSRFWIELSKGDEAQ